MNSREKGSSLTMLLGSIVVLILLALAALQLFNRYRATTVEHDSAILTYAAQGMNLAMLSRLAVTGTSNNWERIESRTKLLASAAEIESAAEAADGANADEARDAWVKMTQGLNGVIEGQDVISDSFDIAARTERELPNLISNMGAVTGALTPRALQAFSPVMARVEVEAREITRTVRAYVSQNSDRLELADVQAKSLAYLTDVMAGLSGTQTMSGVPSINAADAAAQLDSMNDTLALVTNDIQTLLDTHDATAGAHREAQQVEAASEVLFRATAGVRSRVGNQPASLLQQWWLPLALLGGALLSALAYWFRSRQESRASMGVAQVAAVEQTDKHQEAILRLLDEMGDLADGDLTVEATITEDITGAIADSINYAIEALRELVSTIDAAAESVDSAAQQTQAAANHLAKASESQSGQVSSATESIAKMAASIEQVSENSETSSEVARNSVEIAHKGGEAVRRTIDGMNTIRETIQDTSKRIKRLGESSQEIGNIVELINDIAEQTNILALNASIQASMAGEAGRGFGVVADEVQRLAERSTNATKQIEVLVRTIQSDTNEAVVSMERSTTDVVSGALLAENAGAALDEIEKVSNQIASLVQNISNSARQQAGVAGDVTRNMGVLQEISAQTAENTGATSRSIGNLAEMASRLRHSVAGFTLPKEKAAPVMPEANYDEMLTELAAEENEFIDTLIVNKSTNQ